MPIIIYGLRCPLTGHIRYVGKAVNLMRRFHEHIYRCRGQSHKDRWIRRLRDQGLRPEVVILHEIADGTDWRVVERAVICAAKEARLPLTNMTAGGSGVELIDLATEERRIANSRAAWQNPELREAQSVRVRAAFARPEVKARKKAKKNWVAHRENVGAAQARRSLAALARRKAVTRARMSDSAKAKWADPTKGEAARAANRSEAKRKRLSEAAVNRATPEYRAMMSARSKATWADPKKRLRIEAGITPEVRAKVSAASKAMWRDHPEKVQACLANLKPRAKLSRKATNDDADFRNGDKAASPT